MKAIDHSGMPLRPKTRRKTKARSNVMFKLRDPVTGLFWGVSMASNPVFNMIGKQWGSEQAAVRNWAEYMYQRILLDDDCPRFLELISYKIQVTETGKSAAGCPDMTVAALFAVAARPQHLVKKILTLKPGDRVEAPRPTPSYSVVSFVKKIALDGFVFTHVIECMGDDMPIPPLKMKTQTIKLRNSYSGLGKPNKDSTLLAVTSETDLIYAKMALQDYIVAIWDVAELIAG
jgi:hypothetical protein